MRRPPPRSPLFPYAPLSRPPAERFVREDRRPRVVPSEERPPLGHQHRWHDEREGFARAECHGERDVRLAQRSEEHTSELQSQSNLVCRLLLEKKKQLTDTRR